MIISLIIAIRNLRLVYNTYYLNDYLDDFSLTKIAEEANLSLRKKKLNDYIFEKRIKAHSEIIANDEMVISFKVKPETLLIPKEHIIVIQCLQNSIDDLFKYLTSNNLDYIKAALYSFRQYFQGSIELNTMQLISNYKIIDLFAQFLVSTEDLVITYEIIWILINFLASDSNNNDMLYPLYTGAILDKYHQLIKHELCAIAENTLWLLCGLSSRSNQYRSIILQHPLYTTTLDLLQKENIDSSVIIQGLEFIAQCIAKADYKHNKGLIFSTLKVFSMHLYSSLTFKNSIMGIQAITHIDYDSYEIGDAIIDSGIIIKLLKTKYQNNTVLLLPGLEIIANTLYVNDNNIEKILSMRLLDFYDSIISQYKHHLIDYYIGLGLSNVAASNSKNRLQLVHSAVFDKVILLISSPNENNREVVLKILANILLSHDSEFALILENKGIIQKVIEKAYEISEEKKKIYIKIVLEYIVSFKKKSKSSNYMVIIEQFKTLLENSPTYCSIDEISDYINDV